MSFDVTALAEAETLWVAADRIRFLGGLPGADLELIEVEVPAGSGTPPHTHASPELFHILEGELTIRHFSAGGAPAVAVAGPGVTVRIGSMEPHNYANESGRPARMLVTIEASMIAFFRDIGTPEPQSEPDFARISAAMQRHGVAMLATAA